MPSRVAINGFGRIGRAALRSAIVRDTEAAVGGRKGSRADDANPCMTSTHPSVARHTLAVPFA
jgi:glyceraldehyde-3-phosphate dehydrogenase/erythrose-4-phosphate dehydrogenase